MKYDEAKTLLTEHYSEAMTRTIIDAISAHALQSVPPPAELAAMEELCAVTLRLIASVDETGDEDDEISLYEVGQAADALLKLREGKPL